jgi:hypothetical protein
LISVPPGTEMFQFPGLAPFRVTDLAARRVAPFGHPGITARMQLPQAYRSLPRPSSPLDAKASTVCLIAFDLKLIVDRTARDAAGLLGVDFHTHTIRPSIVKERKQNEQEMPGVRATSETLSAHPGGWLTRDLQKGGDPAAGSPTATLLRLRPSH